MDPDKFDNLPRTSDGLPIVTLMTDPDMGPDGADGFLSLVDRGANGRRISVVKHADRAQKVGDDQAGHEVMLDLGQQPGLMQRFVSLFAPLLGLSTPGTALKSDAVSFDEAVVIPLVFDRLWDGISALEQSIGSILRDETVRDKQQAVDIALAAFAQFVSSAFSQVPTLKADQAAAVRIAAIGIAQKADRHVIKSADLATISAALVALEGATSTLQTLAARGTLPPEFDKSKDKGKDKPKGDKADKAAQEDPDMTPEMIATVADSAAKAAQLAHKAAVPAATAAELAQVGQSARMEVIKAAVAGPPQPGIPTTLIKDQIAESAGITGKAPAPLAKFEQAIARLTSLTSKIDETLHGKPAEGDTEAVVGLAQVVEKQGEALAAVVSKVAKVAGTPRPSNSGGDQPLTDAEKEIARKAAEADTFKGTALGGF